MKDKLLYRSQFQPAPRSKYDDDYGLPSTRRRSPYRSASRHMRQLIRNFLRLSIIILLMLFFDRVTGWRNSSWCQRWLWGKGIVKSAREWRQGYYSLDLGLKGLPEGFNLPNGDEIPSVGLGTWKASSDDVGGAIKAALEAGYRHVDCAWKYGNEAEIGDSLLSLAHHVPRESLFITSKLWNWFHSPDDIEPVLDQTLSRLQTNYLDLYLVHWPVAQHEDGTLNEELTLNPLPTWRKLEEMVRRGKVRNLGVSNFNTRRLQNLTESDISIRPVINQVELNYWNPQPELVKWAKANNILLEAYSPFGGDGMVSKTLRLPVVKKIARKLRITPAQVIISWHVQRGTVVLPKSTDAGRISENYQLFTLPSDLFQELESAATSHRPHRLMDPSRSWGVDIFEDERDDIEGLQ